jgi:hypothetical protein
MGITKAAVIYVVALFVVLGALWMFMGEAEAHEGGPCDFSVTDVKYTADGETWVRLRKAVNIDPDNNGEHWHWFSDMGWFLKSEVEKECPNL